MCRQELCSARAVAHREQTHNGTSPLPCGGFFTGGITMAKKPKLLSDLFHDTLKDVYFAENKILKTLPKMAKAAQSKDLKAAFVKHERETRGQIRRLQGVFKILGKKPQAKTCEAIMGITK